MRCGNALGFTVAEIEWLLVKITLNIASVVAGLENVE
jgi:hypothetical protein